jgi:hypothetical protein
MDSGLAALVGVGVVALVLWIIGSQGRRISGLEAELWRPFDCPWCDGTAASSQTYYSGDGISSPRYADGPECGHCDFLGKLYRGPDGQISNRRGPPAHPITLPKWAADKALRGGKGDSGHPSA